MKKNVGGIDKTARMVIGALLVLVGTVGIQSIALTIIGLIVMGTGVFGFCGLYSVLGINTACKIATKDGEKKEGE